MSSPLIKIIPGGITRRMIYTISSEMKQGDIWLAEVLFKEVRQTKQCSVIIVGNELLWIEAPDRRIS